MDGLKELSDKISSYNIFNYLLPGILFAVIVKTFTGMDFILESNFLGVFLYYFIGMVISMFGSLVVEPLLHRINFVKFYDYKSFLLAARNDNQLELLAMINNLYQNILSMSVLLIIFKIYTSLAYALAISTTVSLIFAIVGVLVLFLFSYRKQSRYITKRIEINNQYL